MKILNIDEEYELITQCGDCKAIIGLNKDEAYLNHSDNSYRILCPSCGELLVVSAKKYLWNL